MTSAPFDSARSDGVAGTTRSGSVDCARTATGACRVGGSSPQDRKETRAIPNAVRVLGHEPVWIRDENGSSWIENGSLQLSPRGDVLVKRSLLTKSDRRFEGLQLAALYADTPPVVNSPQALADALYKYRAGTKLAAAGLPAPDAYYRRPQRTFQEWPARPPDETAHKPRIGTNGQRMSVVSRSDPVGPTIDDEQSFVEEFLEGRDVLEAYTLDISRTVGE